MNEIYIQTASLSAQPLDVVFDQGIIVDGHVVSKHIPAQTITKDQLQVQFDMGPLHSTTEIHFSNKENTMAKKYKKIGPLYKGIMFDGTNGADVVAYFRDLGFTARAGGNWVRIQTPGGETPHIVATRGTWVLREEFTNELKTVMDEVFQEDFKRSGRRTKDVSYIKRAANVEAIQLDDNAKEVAEFARSKGRAATAGGGWVKFSDRTAKNGDWVIWHPEAQGLSVMDELTFDTTYAVTR